MPNAALFPAGKSRVEGVEFQFNPKSITWRHSAPPRESAGSGGGNAGGSGADPEGGSGSALTAEQELAKLGKTSLKVASLVFDGNDVTKNCGMLMDWSYAIQVWAKNPKKRGSWVQVKQLPGLIFEWGSFIVAKREITSIPVLITNADIGYERFDSSGRPIRATVGLDLQLNDYDIVGLQYQNPTSGGLPGRRQHVLTSGETLPGIALAAYAGPDDWRPLAEANNLDDPLRVRPGTTLYLPNRTELGGRGPA